jgi:hypothetical protein
MADLTIKSMPRQLSDLYTPLTRLPRNVLEQADAFLRPIAHRMEVVGALLFTIDLVALCAGNTTGIG